MNCEICSEKEAVVHLKQVIEGEARELHVCAECAAESGLDVRSPLSMTDFLFGMGLDKPKSKPEAAEGEKTCKVCTMRLSEFNKRSRLGCPTCYETFAEEIVPYLGTMHRGASHVGKIPRDALIAREAGDLRKTLEEAVARQDFEEAARLRDRLNALKGPAESPCAPEGGSHRAG